MQNADKSNKLTTCPFQKGGSISKVTKFKKSAIDTLHSHGGPIVIGDNENEQISNQKNIEYFIYGEFGDPVVNILQKETNFDPKKIPSKILWNDIHSNLSKLKEVEMTLKDQLGEIIAININQVIKGDDYFDKLSKIHNEFKTSGVRETFSIQDSTIQDAINNGMRNIVGQIMFLVEQLHRMKQDYIMREPNGKLKSMPRFMSHDALAGIIYEPLKQLCIGEMMDKNEMFIDYDRNYAYTKSFTANFRQHMKKYAHQDYIGYYKAMGQSKDQLPVANEPIFGCPFYEYLEKIYYICMHSLIYQTDLELTSESTPQT